MFEQLAWIGTGRCEQSHYIAQALMMAFIFVGITAYVLIIYKLLKDTKTPSLGKRLVNCVLFSTAYAVVAFFVAIMIGLAAACAG